MRAAAIAASHPACPAPTTTTSYCSVNAIQLHKNSNKAILRIPSGHLQSFRNGSIAEKKNEIQE
jgi:hypothetical protein